MSVNRIIIDLQHEIPGKEGEEKIQKIRLSRFKAKHLKFLPKNFGNDDSISPDAFIPLIAGLAGLPETSIEELDIADLVTVTEKLESFLSQSLAIGK